MDKHDVRKGIEIDFADGLSRTVFPLTIKSLRKFVKIVEKMKDLEDMTTVTDEDIDTMMDAAQVILEKVDPGLANDRDALEDAVDLNAFAKMMNIAMGASAPKE